MNGPIHHAAGKIAMRGTRFLDEAGRHVILRGVNFGGDSKVPMSPDERTWLPTDFADHRTVSFVGRPAPLDQLDSHLARLRHWGFNCVRLLTTWEAVEHAGPGQYDQAYLDYYAEVCRRAGDYGLRVLVDFHQDVWSRMSGGDGAPGWTFEAAGLDFTKFHAAGGAHVMQYEYDAGLGGRQAGYPTMSWSGNYAGPANGIMWTLFFAGNDFAPAMCVNGKTVQDFLQGHYLGAMRAIADRIAGFAHVIGFDTLNEPGSGYIGKALEQPIRRGRGPSWTALDGLAVASGISRELPVAGYRGEALGSRLLNPDGITLWREGHADPFREAGAWDVTAQGAPVALEPDYFSVLGGRQVDHVRDYMAPFFNGVADTIRAVRPDWLVFAEFDPFNAATGAVFPDDMPERTVNASHWYDIAALATKRFSTERDMRTIEDGYVREMAVLENLGRQLPGGAPTLLGECGIQYDMNDAEAYARWAGGERGADVWIAQTTALDLMYNAIDRLLLSSTQWNYTVSNRNDPMIGDGWNQEDLSIWSADQASDGDPASGGRAVDGFCRPYVRAAQGMLLGQKFDRATGIFEATIECDPGVPAPTEIYVPRTTYPDGFAHEISAPATVEQERQVLRISSETNGTIAIRLVRR